MEKNYFVTGTPSYEESDIIWKRNNDEPDVTNDEYTKAIDSLTTHLLKWCPVMLGLDDGYCYVRGDNFGDRTQYVGIFLPEIINNNFTNYLQKWVCEYRDKGTWRILIPTYLTNAEAIFIYPDIIRLGKKYDNMDLSVAYAKIVEQIRRKDNADGVYLPRPSSLKGVSEPRYPFV